MRDPSQPVGIFRISHLRLSWLLTALIPLVGGCSSDRADRQSFAQVITPQPPRFLTGPTSLLLTNQDGFSARVEFQSETSMGAEKISSGQLLGKGGKLLYAPEGHEDVDTHRKPGGYSFIWDVAQSRGFVLSEALQGYAPVVADLHVTNIVSAAGNLPSQRLGGHPCEATTVSAQTADGGAESFEVYRALDQRNFPLRIQTQTNTSPFSLNLSKVRFEPLADAVFAPPEGFTAYPSPQALADELAARQHNLHRKFNSPIDRLPDFSRPSY